MREKEKPPKGAVAATCDVVADSTHRGARGVFLVWFLVCFFQMGERRRIKRAGMTVSMQRVNGELAVRVLLLHAAQRHHATSTSWQL